MPEIVELLNKTSFFLRCESREPSTRICSMHVNAMMHQNEYLVFAADSLGQTVSI